MSKLVKDVAVVFLQTLVGQPLLYAIKSPDTELYDFGFGELIECVNHRGKPKRIGTHILHILCRFKVIWKNNERKVDRYYEDTPCEEFNSNIQHVIGLAVKRVALSSKNDLWLDFGACWIVFVTVVSGGESWRFFFSDTEIPHLVAADAWLEFS